MPAHGARPVQSRAGVGDLWPDIVGSSRSWSAERVACTMMRATAGMPGCFFMARALLRRGCAHPASTRRRRGRSWCCGEAKSLQGVCLGACGLIVGRAQEARCDVAKK